MPLCVAALLLTTGCKKEKNERTFSFEAEAEMPAAEGDAKSHLVNEEYVYWDLGDQISINSNVGEADDLKVGVLQSKAGEGFNGVFVAELLDGSNKFAALYPHASGNVIELNNSGAVQQLRLDYPSVQEFSSDFSFSQGGCPMVAYNNSGNYPFLMRFHNLCGIVRVELYSTLGETYQLSDVTFTSTSHISGLFDVRDYDKAEPYLVGGTNNTITIPCAGRYVGGGSTALLTFYLTLPQTAPNGADVEYPLTMTVHATQNGTHMQVVKNVTLKIRRNGITKLPALNLNSWSESGNGDAEAGIVGDGSEMRPFQIYSVADLVKVRDAMNTAFNAHTSAKINGITVTTNSFFRIMRSDIVLTDENWTSSIERFTGHLTYTATTMSSTPGITNNTSRPIVNELSEGSVIENIAIKGTAHFTVDPTASESEFTYSPLCRTNRGTIRNCEIASTASFSLSTTKSGADIGVGGICVSNWGTVEGCGCRGTLTSNNHSVAGVCFINEGTVRGCYCSSPMGTTESTGNMGGICYKNTANGSVVESYFAASTVNTKASVGGIVYENSGMVNHCYVGTESITTTAKLGGIVNKNISGVVDYCFVNSSALSALGNLGGIVCDMTGGEVRNCYMNRPSTALWCKSSSTEVYCGGVVALLNGGAVRNSYAYVNFSGSLPNKGTVAGRFAKGTIVNCYGMAPDFSIPFYGMKDAGETATVSGCFSGEVGTTPPEGITYIPSTTFFTDMTAALNAWVATNGSYYLNWEQLTPSSEPTLHNPYSAKKHRRR